MNSLQESFARKASQKRAGFIPFIVAGDPDLATTGKLLIGLSKLEPVAIEIGVPFSDPTADGPVIQRAAQRSLEQGTSLASILTLLKSFARNELAPIVLFSYYNPIFQFGLAKFARAAAECEVAGVLVVDLPAEAAAPLQEQLRRKKIDLVFLVTPTTTDLRLKQIARLASGFIYAVARTGVTGTTRELRDESESLVARIRALTNLPVAVGFGITNGVQARRVCRYADAAVVGSRLVAEM
ncbi:MAG: tryptophan synthase subunit alpha, partial [Verrucomicrobiota bacterium]|nr:tryptophan synthase subunit alpha [Verrucomicrobiota bacterium]